MTQERFPRLYPAQVCFVVEDVAQAAEECVASFGWGPFHHFTAPVPEARYRNWSGAKKTDVALGMAGAVQVELIHVHEGHDTVEAYQARYGPGLQHLGISCRDRDEAIAALAKMGGVVDDQGEQPGIRFAFVDTPTGPGMFELLEATGETPAPGPNPEEERQSSDRAAPSITVDRATIVTADLDQALEFYARAFRWEGVRADTHTLRFGATESRVRRARGQAGQLLLELVQPQAGSDDPYARHLARGDHGLVHAGATPLGSQRPGGATIEGEWLEEGEVFGLYSWAGGPASLQVRGACA